MQSSSRSKGPLAIAEAFKTLKDPRRVKSCDHPLLTVVVIAIAGVICGAQGWEELEQFGEAKRAWFETFLDMPHGVPRHDTFRRVFSALRPAAFSLCVRAWLAQLAGPLAGKVLAIDGKTLRGVTRGSFAGTPLHLVHAWASEQRLLLGQVATEGAPGEQDALEQLVAMVDLRGAIVTTDANTCSSKTAACVREAGGHYVLHLKANRKPLYTFVESYFAAARADQFRAVPHSFHCTAERGHGRGEVPVSVKIVVASFDQSAGLFRRAA